MFKRIGLLSLLICVIGSFAFAGGGQETAGEELTEIHYLSENSNIDIAGDGTPRRLEELLGLPVIPEMLPAGDAGTQKMLLKLTGGETIDLVVVPRADFTRAVAGGAVTDLTELLEARGGNITAAIWDETWQTVTTDGKVFGIPQASEQSGGVVEGVLIRKDILDSAGVKVPATPAELYDAAKAIKAANPEMYPLTTSLDQKLSSGYWLPFVQVASGFGLTTEWVEKGGKLIPSIKQDEMKEFLAYMHKLYAEGLVDPEFPAHDRESRNRQFINGVSAMTKVHWWDGMGIAQTIRSTGGELDVVYMPPLKNAKGESGVEQIASVVKVAFIPRSARNPGAVIEWINRFLEPAAFEQAYLGTEGVTYERQGGDYFPIQPAFNDTMASAYWFIPATIQEDLLSQRMWGARLKKNDDLVWGWEDLQASSRDVSVIDPTAYAPPIEVIVQNTESLRTFVVGKMTDMIVSGFSSADYDAFVAKWEAMGGAEVESALNDWFSGS